jgi:hypothetical protein
VPQENEMALVPQARVHVESPQGRQQPIGLAAKAEDFAWKGLFKVGGAAALGFVGVAIYLASNQALTLLALSGQYAAATTDMQRSLLLVAGQTILVIHQNAGYEGVGIYPGFFCVTVAGRISAVVMLRSHIFGRATAYLGILANGFGLSYYLTLVFTPALIALPLSISALFLLAWYLLISRRLFQLGKAGLVCE